MDEERREEIVKEIQSIPDARLQKPLEMLLEELVKVHEELYDVRANRAD